MAEGLSPPAHRDVIGNLPTQILLAMFEGLDIASAAAHANTTNRTATRALCTLHDAGLVDWPMPHDTPPKVVVGVVMEDGTLALPAGYDAPEADEEE